MEEEEISSNVVERNVVAKDEDLSIDEINKIVVKNRKIFYDVDVANKKGKILGVRLYESDYVRTKAKEKLIKFL